MGIIKSEKKNSICNENTGFGTLYRQVPNREVSVSASSGKRPIGASLIILKVTYCDITTCCDTKKLLTNFIYTFLKVLKRLFTMMPYYFFFWIHKEPFGQSVFKHPSLS